MFLYVISPREFVMHVFLTIYLKSGLDVQKSGTIPIISDNEHDVFVYQSWTYTIPIPNMLFFILKFTISLKPVFLLRIGLDLAEGCVRDNRKAGVFEPTISKIKSLKFATEAAITILRIDDMIKLAPEEKKGRSYQDACNAGDLDGWSNSLDNLSDVRWCRFFYIIRLLA